MNLTNSSTGDEITPLAMAIHELSEQTSNNHENQKF